MKVIKTFSGHEFMVSDSDAEIIAGSFGAGKLIKLKTGEWLNPKSIELIGDPELVPTWKGYILDKNGRFFMRDNQRVYLEPHNYDEIEYEPNPKYKMMAEILKEKMKMISDKEISEVNTEIAIGEKKRTKNKF